MKYGKRPPSLLALALPLSLLSWLALTTRQPAAAAGPVGRCYDLTGLVAGQHFERGRAILLVEADQETLAGALADAASRGDTETGHQAIDAFSRSIELRAVRALTTTQVWPRSYLLEFPESREVSTVLDGYCQHPEIAQVQPNLIYATAVEVSVWAKVKQLFAG